MTLPFQVDVVGMAHFWGLTINTIVTINIVITVGMSVDYSVHIAHAFFVSRGK